MLDAGADLDRVGAFRIPIHESIRKLEAKRPELVARVEALRA